MVEESEYSKNLFLLIRQAWQALLLLQKQGAQPLVALGV